MNSAKLFVALGALDQTSGGETFWPGHGGLVRDVSAPANLDGHTSPSLNAGEVNVNGGAVATALVCAAAAPGCGVWMRALEPFYLARPSAGQWVRRNAGNPRRNRPMSPQIGLRITKMLTTRRDFFVVAGGESVDYHPICQRGKRFP
jgi:hypothetical protein